MERNNKAGIGPRSLVGCGLATLLVAPFLIVSAAAQQLYWTDFSDKIQSTDVNAVLPVDVVTSPLTFTRAVAVDSTAGKVYIAESGIKRINLDGSGLEQVVAESPWAIALDVGAGKVYWTDQIELAVKRADLDGSNVETVVVSDPMFGIAGLDLDLVAGKVYWGLQAAAFLGGGGIMRANLDGSSVETVVPGIGQTVEHLALAPTIGKIYWTLDAHPLTFTDAKVQRANLDGTMIEDLVAGSEPDGIAVDAANNEFYWEDPGVGGIARAELNGANPGLLLEHTGTGRVGLFIDPLSSRLYFTEFGVAWFDLNSGTVTPVLANPVAEPVGLALDAGAGKMYWADTGVRARLQRANLDGTNIESLLEGPPNTPFDITLDPLGGKMYWPDQNGDRIQRANLDGSNVETIVATGLGSPESIAIDLLGGQVYYIDDEATVGDDITIDRADLNGSNAGTFLNLGGVRANSLAIDSAAQKLYFGATDTFNGATVRRINFDGSGFETILPDNNIGRPERIALDLENAKLYIADESNGRIFRSNLDGSGLEEFATGLGLPYGIAIDTAPVPVLCEIAMTQDVYQTGQTVTIATLRLANQTTASTPLRFRLRLTPPPPATGTIDLIDIGGSGTFSLPGGFDIDLGPIPLFQAGAPLLPGAWEFACQFDHPMSGELRAIDKAGFELP